MAYRTSYLKPIHTLEETSKKFGISKSTVLAIEKRALAKLKEELNKRGYFKVSDLLDSNDKQDIFEENM